MPTSQPEAAEKIRALRENYRGALPEKISGIQRLAEAFLESLNPDLRASLEQELHRIKGSASTYGFNSLSQLAADFETVLEQEPPSREQILGTLNALVRSFETGVEEEDALDSHNRDRSGFTEDLVYLLDTDGPGARDLCAQVENFGFRVELIPDLSSLREAMSHQRPVAILTALADHDDQLVQALSGGADGKPGLPVLALSDRTDVEARLKAVRAGYAGFFARPVDVRLLVEGINQLSGQRPSEPYRVLIVDDNEDVANYYRCLMEDAEVRTEVITNPLRALDICEQLRPDLILLDVYMEECSGPELAQVIRQRDDMLTVPIVFLSAETDEKKQLDAINAGGDEFLSKALSGPRLVEAVIKRCARGRKLTDRMIRDGLTGLLNHSASEYLLEVALARATREQKPVSVVMMDIDHFKRINDGHGHQTGDRVLQQLATLLQQRLRGTDIVGRYGGEEFIVVMPETGPDDTLRVLTDIRETFGSLRLTGETGTFSATFSFGIAHFPGRQTAASLIEAADKALYQAKAAGRNCGFVAPQVLEAEFSKHYIPD